MAVRWAEGFDTAVFAFFFLLFGVMRARREREIRHGTTITLDPGALQVRKRLTQRATDIQDLKKRYFGGKHASTDDD